MNKLNQNVLTKSFLVLSVFAVSLFFTGCQQPQKPMNP